jgi:hypothetical protein
VDSSQAARSSRCGLTTLLGRGATGRTCLATASGRGAVCVLALIGSLGPASSICAQSREVAELREFSERQVMATYFFRLAMFYEWPEAQAPAVGEALVACLIGRDPFRNALDFSKARAYAGDPLPRAV